jgi:hypothetical protein
MLNEDVKDLSGSQNIKITYFFLSSHSPLIIKFFEISSVNNLSLKVSLTNN